VLINRYYFRKRETDFTRINHQIRVPYVRLVDKDGEARGVVQTKDAIQLALDSSLDLVEVAPNAEPPVCRVMNYGKYKYEKSKKAKEAKKKQHVVHLKEVKFHPKTDEHDYHFKMEHARKFILKGDRVKATVVFRGREITHLDRGRMILDKLDRDLQDITHLEQQARMEGRNMISIYLPDKVKVGQYLRRLEQEKKNQEHAVE
jgi:translation initiation factor IF-3